MVQIHFDAFRGSSNTRIGRGYVRAFLNWFQSRESAIAFVSGIDDSLTGYVVGAALGYERDINRYLFPIAVQGFIMHPWALADARILRNVLARMKSMTGSRAEGATRVPTLPQPVMSLVGIGVRAVSKGDGSASRLIESFEEESWSRNFAAVRLSVHAVNERAIHFYERSGWSSFRVPDKDYLYCYKHAPDAKKEKVEPCPNITTIPPGSSNE